MEGNSNSIDTPLTSQGDQLAFHTIPCQGALCIDHPWSILLELQEAARQYVIQAWKNQFDVIAEPPTQLGNPYDIAPLDTQIVQ